jgi:nucleoside-diphosphate-sugar epimerase
MTFDPHDNPFRDQRILVTGGAGFIGSHLAHQLLHLGARVNIIDNLATGNRANLPDHPNCAFFEASILDEPALTDAVEHCAYVFHEAAMVSVPLSVEQPLACGEINITGTERVLEAANTAGVRRLIFASSAAVYGDHPSLPSTETDEIVCCSPYAASKAAGEALLSAFGCCYRLSTVSLRYFNIFGPRQDPKSAYAAVIAAFMDAFANNRQPTIFGDGSQTRDFTCIDNVVHANLLAAASPHDLKGEVFNIGTGARISLLDLFAELKTLHHSDLEPAFGPPPRRRRPPLLRQHRPRAKNPRLRTARHLRRRPQKHDHPVGSAVRTGCTPVWWVERVPERHPPAPVWAASGGADRVPAHPFHAPRATAS